MKTIRRIPTDTEIELGFRRMRSSQWATIYSRLVIYGLRPHEAFLGTVMPDGLFVVPNDTKTGERFVPPLERKPAWLHLTAGVVPKVTAHQNREYGSRTWQAFKRHDIPFNPYDLRHRFVVLTEERGIPPAIAANWAGHSCRTRYLVYTKTLDQRRSLAYAKDNGYLLDHQPNNSNQPHASYPI
jgi:hypothetical protein